MLCCGPKERIPDGKCSVWRSAGLRRIPCPLLLSLCPIRLALWDIPHIADIIHCNESGWILPGDVLHQLLVFVLIHNRDDFIPNRTVICPLSLIDGRAAFQGMDNPVANLLFLIPGYDADPSLPVLPILTPCSPASAHYHRLLVIDQR